MTHRTHIAMVVAGSVLKGVVVAVLVCGAIITNLLAILSTIAGSASAQMWGIGLGLVVSSMFVANLKSH